ncbi:MAG: hypothetical protein JSW50_07830 [Candidatus Latescibacterota bacterium]|nr:MAG: hypothetical protein JSW50_07830 [Candidatus Latescibacterota bacterium]
MTRLAKKFICSTLLAILMAMPALADKNTPPFSDFLRDNMGLSDTEIANLAAGKLLVNVFDVEDNRELLLCGVAKVDVPSEFALANLESLVAHRHENGVLQIERFSSPPSVADIEEFELPDEDIKDLKKAKRGKSNVKITERFLKQIETEIDWTGDYTADVNRIYREMLVRRVTDYLGGGLDSLKPYVDKDPPQTVRDGMRNILGRSSALYEHVPEFATYLDSYPNGELEGAADLLYCVYEDFGMKPTLSTRHVSFYQPTQSYSANFMLAEINIYSSHYFQAMYSMTTFLEADLHGEDKSSYVILIQRFWFDKELKGMKRRSAEGRLSNAMEESFSRQRDRLVASYKNQ